MQAKLINENDLQVATYHNGFICAVLPVLQSTVSWVSQHGTQYVLPSGIYCPVVYAAQWDVRCNALVLAYLQRSEPCGLSIITEAYQ